MVVCKKSRAHWFHGSDAVEIREMNNLEWPLALLSRNTSTEPVLHFHDEIRDQAAGTLIPRSCTISANALTRLPNYWDVDALIALEVITFRKHRFSSEIVEFTLYETLKEMRLPAQTKNYRRLAASFDNWMGVMIKYSHWRVGDTWHHPEAFSVIQDYSLTRRGKGAAAPEKPQVFAWSRLFAQSVRDEHTKGFNSDFYFSLSTPTAKRLYSFLDKRLYNTKYWTPQLVPFCQMKLGMTRNCAPSGYPRKIHPAYNELVEKRYLADIPESRRIIQENGKTKIQFRRGPGRKVRSFGSVPETVVPDQLMFLRKRCVETQFFQTRWKDYRDYDFELACEYYDHLVETKSKLIDKNPQGFLFAFCKRKSSPPSSYHRKADRERRATERERKRLAEEQRTQVSERQQVRERQRKLARIESAPKERRDVFVKAAFAKAERWLVEHYESALGEGHTERAQAYYESILLSEFDRVKRKRAG